jgi:hypothetical protein
MLDNLGPYGWVFVGIAWGVLFTVMWIDWNKDA